MMLTDNSFYSPATQTLWQGRKDTGPDERFFQKVTCLDIRKDSLPPHHIVFAGFASDEGIRRNEGRTGAKAGPDEIKTHLARLASNVQRTFYDAGQIVCENGQLEKAQLAFSELIHHCHQQNCKTMAFGGGHEIAFGHFMGLTEHYPKIGIINFDAHFDLRNRGTPALSTSGTPFLQIAKLCQKKSRPFSYCCLGIQTSANTQSLFQMADQLKVSYLTAEQIHTSHLAWQTAFLDDFILSHDAIYLSLCLDVFAESFAPGVSAPQPLGITPWQALPLLKYILQTGKVVSIDIAELSPPLDNHGQTARLAAMIAAQMLETY